METLELHHPTYSHNCYRCSDLFDSDSLRTPCPQCGCVEGRDSICLDPAVKDVYGIQRSRDWPYILALHELPAWGATDLPEHYSDYRARNGDRLDFEAFVDEHFVRHPFRPEVRYLRRADYAAALAAIDAHEEAG